jgi:transcriptional repressor NrdR
VEEIPFRVIKKDGTRVPFDRERILSGMARACEKRPVSMDDLDRITDDIESRINEMFDREVAAKFIGHMVMEALRRCDQVAYVRFASVYREFKDVSEFMDELKTVMDKRRHG